MAIYLLSPDQDNRTEAIETKLFDIIPQLRKIKNVEEIAADLTRKTDGKIIVIFLSPVILTGAVDNLINISSRYRERIFFILVSNDISANDYKRLIRSGGAEWIAAGGPLQEILETIYKQSKPSDEYAASHENAKPVVVSFLPCAGGVGNTTVALEVALHIKLAKASRSWKICYVDLDFQTSHVCDFLDIEARLKIAEIFEQPDRLDEQLLELFVNHHSSGLDVFAAPRSKLDPCEVNVEALDILLEMISKKYDFIVLDLPVSWFNWTVPTIENSSAAILTGLNTIPGLRQMRITLDAVLGIKALSSQVAIAMNRVTGGLLGGTKRRGHVERILSGQKIFYVHEDPKAVDRVNTGTPAALGAPGRYTKDIAKLASFCAALTH
jgi:pilus assembly protein CpaE